MKLVIHGWSGDSIWGPSVGVELDSARLTTIEMANGTGKTTFIGLIWAALLGSSSDWDAKKILSFRNVAAPQDAGWFALQFSIDDQRITSRIEFDFQRAECRTVAEGPSTTLAALSQPDVRDLLNLAAGQSQLLDLDRLCERMPPDSVLGSVAWPVLIERCPQWFDRGLLRRNLAAGDKAELCIILLAASLNMLGHRLPLVWESPFAMMDIEHQWRCFKILLEFSSQTIVFERDERGLSAWMNYGISPEVYSELTEEQRAAFFGDPA